MVPGVLHTVRPPPTKNREYSLQGPFIPEPEYAGVPVESENKAAGKLRVNRLGSDFTHVKVENYIS